MNPSSSLPHPRSALEQYANGVEEGGRTADGGQGSRSPWQCSPAVLQLMEEDRALASRRAELQEKGKLFKDIRTQLLDL